MLVVRVLSPMLEGRLDIFAQEAARIRHRLWTSKNVSENSKVGAIIDSDL
jgi:hypothetical protein